jgi:transposase InsO family protein
MKLSPYQIQIERAYQAILADLQLLRRRHDYAFDYTPRHPRHVLSREQPHLSVPCLPVEYPPECSVTPFQAKEQMVRLQAFQATFEGSVTPMTPDMIPLILDTGASISITPFKSDFITPIWPVQHVNIKGIASGLIATGIGDVSDSFVNDAGETQELLLRNCLHVPSCAVRLICPRQIGATTGNSADGFYVTHTSTTLIVNGSPTTINYDTISQLPILFTKPGITSFLAFQETLQCYNATSEHASTAQPCTLTKCQRQKLYLHQMCAHEGFGNLNQWIRQGRFPKVDTSLALEPDPMCPACAFGKARRISHKTHTGQISKDHIKPGDGVSSDGLESGTPGRPFTTKGSASKLCYLYVSFWVDHASSYVYVTFHCSKAASELVRSKLEFEQFSPRFGIQIKNIRADNGVYSAQLFRDSCTRNQQILTFCAIGAHWQNGIAERFIGTITQRARTILLHAMAKWPSVISEDMWMSALRHAVNFHNSSFRKTQQVTPYEAFTGQVSPWSINDFRVFGSPTYVLRKELQDGVTLNKWKPRSWLGVYIGTSNCHASAIPLIYNPTSTHVSPQFHVIYDEYFYTVNPSNSAISDVYLSKLYNSSAKWLYRDPYSDDTHLFSSFWDDTVSSPIPRKRPCPTTIPEPHSRGSAATPDSYRISPGCLRGSVHTLDPTQTTSTPPGYPIQHLAPPEPSMQEPLAAPAQPTIPLDAPLHANDNLGALNTSVHSTHLASSLHANPDPHASAPRPTSVPTSM